MEKHKTILITGEEPCSADGKPGGLAARPRLRGKAFAGLLVDISAGRYAAGDNVLFIMTVGSPRPLRLCEGFPRRGPQGFDLSNVLNPLPRSGWKHRNASGKCRTSSSPKQSENSHEIYCRNIRRTFVDPAGHGA